VDDALAMMVTMTTDGAWIPEEERQCVEQDVILPAEPFRERRDAQASGDSVHTFSRDQLQYVGKLIGASLQQQPGLRIWALAVQSWYAHLVVAATRLPVDRILQCADEAVRAGLELKRPVWGDGYLKRFCFDEETVGRWITYVERHNIAVELPAKPWPFIETPDLS
jgi:hypothetical protein